MTNCTEIRLLRVSQLQCEAIASMHYTGVDDKTIHSGGPCRDSAVGFVGDKPLCYAHLTKAGGGLIHEEPEHFAARWRELDRRTAVVR
jgi:hypothetical protein